MKILVIAATEFEIKPFAKENKVTDILITGVGIPETIFNLNKTLFQNKYDLVIQAGIAGTYNHQLKQNTVAIVSQDTFGDIGIEEKKSFSTLFENGFANKNDFPYSNGWLINPNPSLANISLRAVKSITVNMVTDDKDRIERIVEKFNPDIESMEGAAFHYVCLRQKIDFIQIRSISNEVGERDKTKWDIKNAVANLNVELKKLVQNFS